MSNLQNIYKTLPRERLKKFGSNQLEDYELIAIILGTGTKKINVIDLAYSLVAREGGIENLLKMNLKNLEKIEGIGEAKSIKIKAILELINRYQKPEKSANYKANSPEKIFDYFVNEYKNEKQEHLVVIALNSSNNIISDEVIFKGTINNINIHAREIFNFAIKNYAAKIIIMHNHPTGNIEPSTEDIDVTKELIKISKIIGIEILDHVIIGDKNFLSLREKTNIIF